MKPLQYRSSIRLTTEPSRLKPKVLSSPNSFNDFTVRFQSESEVRNFVEQKL